MIEPLIESWLEGLISIEAALAAGSRPVEAIYAQRGKWQPRDWRLRRLQQTAEAAGVSIQYVDAAFIAAHADGESHGGLIARVGPRRFLTPEKLVAEKERPFVVMLDGIEDPFNFGQAVRSLYAAGADGVLVRPRNWMSAAAIVARASAGASEWAPMAVMETAEAAAAFYGNQGLIVGCMAQDSAVSIYETDLTRPLFLLLGGEKRGITRSFLKQADLRLQIPYLRRDYQHALGTAAATAVIAFERLRQVNALKYP